MTTKKNALLEQGNREVKGFDGPTASKSNEPWPQNQDRIRMSMERFAMIFRVMAGWELPGEREQVTIEEVYLFRFVPHFGYFLMTNQYRVQLFEELEDECINR